MTNDRLTVTHRLNYHLHASIHFIWPMTGQYDVIFYRHNENLVHPFIYILGVPPLPSSTPIYLISPSNLFTQLIHGNISSRSLKIKTRKRNNGRQPQIIDFKNDSTICCNFVAGVSYLAVAGQYLLLQQKIFKRLRF